MSTNLILGRTLNFPDMGITLTPAPASTLTDSSILTPEHIHNTCLDDLPCPSNSGSPTIRLAMAELVNQAEVPSNPGTYTAIRQNTLVYVFTWDNVPMSVSGPAAPERSTTNAKSIASTYLLLVDAHTGKFVRAIQSST